MAGSWAPYTGTGAIILTVVLVAIAAVFAFLGFRLKTSIAPTRPGRTAGFFIIVIWIVSILGFFVDSISYGFILEKTNLGATYESYTMPNPVSHITEAAAIATFVIIAFLTRKHGVKVALLSAFVGAASAAMIFELPFDLIVLNRIYPPIPPAPLLFRLLFFIPLFLIELSTLSFLTFSPATRLTKYTLFSLAGFFLVFAIWAGIGFPYPSGIGATTLNDVSKVLAFVVAITLFAGRGEKR